MAYKIIGEDGKAKQHKGKDLLGSDVAIEKTIVDADKRIVKVVSSSDRQDRDGDRINQKGIDHQFAKSVLYAHDYGYSFLPIGKILGIETEKRKDHVVTIETHQMNPPGAYELSDAAWKLIEFGALNATSIGFIPNVTVRAENDEDRERLGLGRWGVLFDSIEKLETSWVPVQGNRDAIREAYGKGIIKPSERQLLFPKDWDKITRPEHWAVGIEFEEKDPSTGPSTVSSEPNGSEPDGKVLERLEEMEAILKGIKHDPTAWLRKVINDRPFSERLDDIEERLDDVEETASAKALAVEEDEPKPEEAKAEGERLKAEKEKEAETHSLDEDQVAEAVTAGIMAGLAKIGDIVEERIKYYKGIV